MNTYESPDRRIRRLTIEWDEKHRLDRDDEEWLIAAARAYILGIPTTRWPFPLASELYR